MTFNPITFDSLYPGHEGAIKARKLLLEHARHFARVRGFSREEWIRLVESEEEGRHYIELIGGPKFLEHLVEWVWSPLNRSK